MLCNIDSCAVKRRDNRPLEGCKKLVMGATKKPEPEIEAGGKITWERVMQLLIWSKWFTSLH